MSEQHLTLIVAIVTVFLSSGIMLTLGKLVGDTKRYGNRLDRHSEKIGANTVKLANFDALVEKLGDLPGQLSSVLNELKRVTEGMADIERRERSRHSRPTETGAKTV